MNLWLAEPDSCNMFFLGGNTIMQALKAAKEYFEEAGFKSPSALKTLLMISTTHNTVFLKKIQAQKKVEMVE